MNLSQSNNQKMVQNQVLTQKQLQSLQILSMGNEELRDFIENEHMENPMLEIADYSSNHENSETLYYDFEVSSQNSLGVYLKSQINENEYSKKELAVINYIIEMIDEDTGFLCIEPDRLYKIFPENKDLLNRCLNIVRSLEPIGVGARNICESLLLQAEIRQIADKNLSLIIKNHLQDIARGKLSIISRTLHLSMEEVRDYIRIIKTLNPKPAQGFGNAPSEYIVPDVIISYDGLKWNIVLNDNWMGSLNINKTYERMAKQTNDEVLRNYFKEKLERARFITNSIEQRRTTLLNVSKAVLNHQFDFITSKGLLKPLILNDIARELDIHLSTVSRTIKNKYMQTPGGTYPFKKFFNSSAVKSEDNGISSAYIKEKIRQIIQDEQKKNPYSDNKISEILKNDNINISRRTVTKYREEMRIPSTIERRTD